MLLLAKIMLIVTLMVGGAGATTVAAQSSLPGDGLYPIKLLVEDARAALTADPQAQIDLHLELAQTRTQEMQQLIAQQRAIPADTPVQLQTQLQAALQAAAKLGDAPLQTALHQIEARVMTQAQLMAQAQTNAPDDRGLRNATQVLAQMQAMTQLGVSDPAAFRARMDAGRPDGASAHSTPGPLHMPQAMTQTPNVTHTVTPAHTPQPSRTPLPSHTPLATRTPNSGTPQGNSYGPGPQASPAPQATPNQGATTQPVATPIGNGDGHEYGPQPTTQPGNGEPQATPSGNSPGPDQTPEPGGGGGGPH
jgi:hypothetical protein